MAISITLIGQAALVASGWKFPVLWPKQVPMYVSASSLPV